MKKEMLKHIGILSTIAPRPYRIKKEETGLGSADKN
jgi:hypothetical protein